MTYADGYAIRTTSANMNNVALALDNLDGRVRTDGWQAVSDTWTYASATTITVPSGATSTYQVGDKIWITQTTSKYFYITAVASTLLTVTGGTAYSVANAAISGIYFSRADRPFGFVPYLPYTPTLTGFSADPASGIYRFSISNGWCKTHVYQGSAGTSNATGFTITAPVTALTLSGEKWGTTTFLSADNGAILSTPSVASIASGAATFVLYKTTVDTAASWTNANGKLAGFTIEYPIASLQ